MNLTDKLLVVLQNANNQNIKLSHENIYKILKNIEAIAERKEDISTLLFFLNAMTPINQLRYSKLTKREQQVLHLIGIGNQNTDVANTLKLSTSTIETHRKNIRKKLKISGNGKLLQYAILNNLHQDTLNKNSDDIL